MKFKHASLTNTNARTHAVSINPFAPRNCIRGCGDEDTLSQIGVFVSCSYWLATESNRKQTKVAVVDGRVVTPLAVVQSHSDVGIDVGRVQEGRLRNCHVSHEAVFLKLGVKQLVSKAQFQQPVVLTIL